MNIPLGLKNLGNTCYVNAVLQALGSSDIFTNAVIELSNYHQHHIQGMDIAAQTLHHNTCLLCILKQYFIIFQSHNPYSDKLSNILALSDLYYDVNHLEDKYVLFPTRFIQTMEVSLNASVFVRGQQQDAHEFLIMLLESFNVQYTSNILSKSLHVSYLCKGSYVNLIECGQCYHISMKTEPFIGLDLDISKSSALSSALDSYFSLEILQHDNAYSCDRCQRKTRSSRRVQLLFEKLPKLLSLQLKRFTPTFTKIQHHVQFPMLLDMQSYCDAYSAATDPSNSSKYQLFAIICHVGSSMYNGHYVAYVRRESKWFYVDDSAVRECDIDEVHKQNAYILFYQRLEYIHNTYSTPSFLVTPEVNATSKMMTDNYSNKHFEVSNEQFNGSSFMQRPRHRSIFRFSLGKRKNQYPASNDDKGNQTGKDNSYHNGIEIHEKSHNDEENNDISTADSVRRTVKRSRSESNSEEEIAGRHDVRSYHFGMSPFSISKNSIVQVSDSTGFNKELVPRDESYAVHESDGLPSSHDDEGQTPKINKKSTIFTSLIRSSSFSSNDDGSDSRSTGKKQKVHHDSSVQEVFADINDGSEKHHEDVEIYKTYFQNPELRNQNHSASDIETNEKIDEILKNGTKVLNILDTMFDASKRALGILSYVLFEQESVR